MDVSIIIVNYNTGILLRKCIESIYEKTSCIEFEIIVVDNASGDDSVKMISTLFPTVKIIASPENIGFGKANNLGAAQAMGELLFFLNSDTELINDAVRILSDFYLATPECGIAGGNLYNTDLSPQHSYAMKLPSAWTELARFIPRLTEIFEGPNAWFNRTEEPREVGYITGADLMISKKLFLESGGFDSDFFMYYEETELTHRIINAGYKVFSVPQAKILHLKGASLEKIEGVKRIVYESKYLYLRKTFGNLECVKAHFIFSCYCLFKSYLHTLFRNRTIADKYKSMRIIDSEVFKDRKEIDIYGA